MFGKSSLLMAPTNIEDEEWAMTRNKSPIFFLLKEMKSSNAPTLKTFTASAAAWQDLTGLICIYFAPQILKWRQGVMTWANSVKIRAENEKHEGKLKLVKQAAAQTLSTLLSKQVKLNAKLNVSCTYRPRVQIGWEDYSILTFACDCHQGRAEA